MKYLTLYLIAPIGLYLMSCGKSDTAKQLEACQEEVARLQTTIGDRRNAHQTFNDKMSDLIAYVEKTWREESQFKEWIQDPAVDEQTIQDKLDAMDLVISNARKRVEELQVIMKDEEYPIFDKDRIEERLMSLDGILLDKQNFFIDIQATVSAKNGDLGGIKAAYRSAQKELPTFQLEDDPMIAELSSLREVVQEAEMTITYQSQLLNDYERKLQAANQAKASIKATLNQKDELLEEVGKQREQLAAEVRDLNMQKMRLNAQMDSTRRALIIETATAYKEILVDLVSEVEVLKKKKDKRKIVELAQTYYSKAAPCNCVETELSDQLYELEEKYLK